MCQRVPLTNREPHRVVDDRLNKNLVLSQVLIDIMSNRCVGLSSIHHKYVTFKRVDYTGLLCSPKQGVVS